MKKEIYFNGKIYTMAGQVVSAMAVCGDKIEAVGTDEEMEVLADAASTFHDLRGKCVVPGFNDSHCHLMMTGVAFDRLDLQRARSMEDLIRLGKEYIEKHQLKEGEWIRGYGFDQNQFENPALPDGSVLDAISPRHPILIERVCGHVGAANPMALREAGFDENTRIEGGILDKDENGKLNGILRETALDDFKRTIPGVTVQQLKTAAILAGKAANELGLTSMQTDDVEAAPIEKVLEAYRQLEAEDQMTIRVFEEVEAKRIPNLERFLKLGLRTGDGSVFFKIGNIKLLTDGSLGARTAYLREDYSDDPGNKGIQVYTQDDLNEIVLRAHEAGMQVACHAIGDGAVEQVVTAYEKAYEKSPADLRHRVVHCQFADDELLERMAKAKICADIQPPFVPSDAPLVPSRLGSREKEGYVWKRMLLKGIHLGGGSDCPVESFSPIWGIHCAVNRTDVFGQPEGGWHPEEKLTVEEAVKLYTKDGAYLSFEEDIKGTLEPGKLADFVVLDQDLFEIPVEKIKDTTVLKTVVGGRVVWEK